MKLKIFSLLLFIAASLIATAQTADKKDAAAKKDSLILAKLKAKGTYPVVKSCAKSGVLPVEGITEKPDNNTRYKLLISLAIGSSEGEKVKKLNKGLEEAGRILNLHVAAGIPKEKIDLVIVTHGKALYALFNNDAFKQEFKADNPNITVIKELQDAGAKFIACGQAMGFLEIKNEQLLPSVKIAMSAKVALSTYQQKGYALYELDEE
jgi:intracellular sulfur oxidation DsrE/DsrF family protein